MIDINSLSQYFPKTNATITENDFSFAINIGSQKSTFLINLKIKQKDSKESHLIKFRLGIGKDRETDSKIHNTSLPHFEIDYYKRESDSFSATVYFTFDDAGDEILLEYAKGTVSIISKILESFIKRHELSKELLQRLVYSENVKKELGTSEKTLLKGLYACYTNENLVVRRDGEKFIIKTPNNLGKYLNEEDLMPIYLPLKEMAELRR